MALDGGRLVSDRFPHLMFELKIADLAITATFLIDTGCDGDSVIPERSIASSRDGIFMVERADGSPRFAPWVFGTEVLPEVGSFSVQATLLGDEHLVGKGLIRRLRILLDHGERVVVER